MKLTALASVAIALMPITPVAAQDTSSSKPYAFERGYPTRETVQKAYDDADLNRAIQAYRFFYPTISAIGMAKGMQEQGIVTNSVIGVMQATPKQIAYTPNSDTPYAPTLLSLKDGPITIEMPPGPLICVAIDFNMRWVADMGVPGPDAGKGGKHILLPPGYTGEVPSGYHAWKSTTNGLMIVVRSLPVGGDIKGSVDRIKAIKIEPLSRPAGWTPLKWVDTGDVPTKASPQALGWDGSFKYWEVLHEVIESEPAFESYRAMYGELAVLGLVKGKPFAPDERMKRILEQAARIGDAQMRVQSFADRRPDRFAWPDRKWEWAALRSENGDFDMPTYVDLDAREKWFYQATGASPAMFRRSEGAGSLYWLGLRDKDDAFLDGGKTYKLTVPLPVPNKLFWSVTVYDAETRSEIVTDQGKAALRSLFELKDKAGESVDLYFGPAAPAGHENEWIKTSPGKGWFTYFRIYGPEKPAFDGSWKPGDFEEVK
ncbi:DUF1254 domain-containing protein [Ensifer sp. LC163]|uniref:DUF1254 domain-containing protein n=1 Tax=Ensifer sp. LC163 TaxID=1120652 RepID=UPI00081362D8|nr:DUF1254 domain-containing protein [Ensifer sp. LC163]OCP35789.1 hypothetical protein BC360_27280 [Ensifer sp. LC163]